MQYDFSYGEQKNLSSSLHGAVETLDETVAGVLLQQAR